MNDRNLRLQVVMSAIDKLTRPFKQARASTQELAASVKKSRDAITQLNQTSAKLDGFKKLQAENLKLGERLDYARNKASLMKQELDASGQPSQRQILALEKQRQTMQKLEERVSAATQKVSQMSQAVSGSAQPSQRQVLALEKQRQATQKLEEQLASARQKTSLMTQATEASVQPSQRQILALEKQRLTIQRLEERQGKLQTKTAQVRAELYRAGISANDGASATARITRETERYNRQLSENEARLRRAGEQQRKLAAARSTYEKTKALRNEIAGSGAGMVATGVATAMPLLAPVKAYSESEDAAAQLAASMMGPGAKILPEFEQINRLALQLGDRLPGTTADFQNMMTMLRRQGMSATAILGGLGEATAYLGVQLKMPATEAAEFAAKLQDATGTAEKDMMGLMDVIQKGFYAGVDPNNMLNGYAKISSAMSILKVRGLDAAKALAPLLVMADQTGMAGESAGNAYRKVFQASMDRDKVSGANDDLKAAGYKIKLNFSDGKGEFAGLDNLYKQLSKIKGLSTEMKLSTLKSIFGDDAETLQVLNVMMDKGIDGYREAGDKLQAQASLRERVDSQLKTLGNRWEAASGSFTNSLAAIGGTVAPQIKQLADWLGELANKLGEFVKKHPQLTSALFKIAAVFALVATAGGALALTIASALGPFALLRFTISKLGNGLPILTKGFSLLSGGLKLAGNAMLIMGRAAMANPILAVIAIIALGALLIWRNWDTLAPKFAAIWNTIRINLIAAWELIKEGISTAWEFIKNVFMDYTLPGIIYKNWDSIKNGVSEAWTSIKNYISQKWEDIITDAAALPDRFKAAGSALIDGLMDGISDKWESLKAKLSSVTDLIPDWLKSDSKAPAISLNKTQPASVLPSTYPQLYDSGGYIPRGQLGIVGENGPELVNGPANITSRRRTAALAGATALAFGSLTTPVTAKPLHPFSLPVQEYHESAQPARQSGTTTAAATPPPTIINVYPTPTQNSADIARELARLLDERDRKAAARTRSSFRDQGGND